MAIYLRLFCGEEEFSVEMKKPRLIFGRSNKCDIKLPDAKCSSTHTLFAMFAGKLTVKDLDSKNGTFVNEEKIEDAYIHINDVVRVGDTAVIIDEAMLTPNERKMLRNPRRDLVGDGLTLPGAVTETLQLIRGRFKKRER